MNESDGHSESAAGTPSVFCIAAVAFESRTLLSARVIMLPVGAGGSPVSELMALEKEELKLFGMAARRPGFSAVKRTSERASASGCGEGSRGGLS